MQPTVWDRLDRTVALLAYALIPVLFLFAVTRGIVAAVGSDSPPDWPIVGYQIGRGFWDLLLVTLPPIAAYIVIRGLAAHAVLHSMMRASGAVGEPLPTAVATKPGPVPTLEMFDVTSRLELPPNLAARWRRSYRSGRPTFWVFLFAWMVVTCGAVWVIASYPADPSKWFEDVVVDDPGPGASMEARAAVVSDVMDSVGIWMSVAEVLPFASLGIAGLVLVIVASRSRLGGSVFVPGAFLGLLIVGATACAATPLREVPLELAVVPGVLGVVVLGTGLLPIVSAARRSGNLHLLVLRVFGCDSNSAFTFGTLERHWRFLGSSLTIADPSYVRYRHSLSYPGARLALVRFGFLFTVAFGAVQAGLAALTTVPVDPGAEGVEPGYIDSVLLSVRDLSGSERGTVVAVLGWIAVTLVTLVPLVLILRARFAKTPAALNAQLRRVAGLRARWNGTHASGVFYCHDDTWKRAVDGMVDIADVVVMDLRGFTPERGGCRYELGLLAARVPFHRVVLVIERDAVDAIRGTLAEVFDALPASSPNADRAMCHVRVYVPGERDRDDALHLVGLLLATNPTEPEPAAVTVTTRSPSRWGQWLRAPRRAARWIGRKIEWIDLATARPAALWVVAPLALIAVGTAFGYSLHALDEVRFRLGAEAERRALRGADVRAEAFQRAFGDRLVAAADVASRPDSSQDPTSPRPIEDWIGEALESTFAIDGEQRPLESVPTAVGSMVTTGDADWTHPDALASAVRAAIESDPSLALVEADSDAPAIWSIDVEVQFGTEPTDDVTLRVRRIEDSGGGLAGAGTAVVPAYGIDPQPSAYAWTVEYESLVLRRGVLLLAAANVVILAENESSVPRDRVLALLSDYDELLRSLENPRERIDRAIASANGGLPSPGTIQQERAARVRVRRLDDERDKSLRVPVVAHMQRLMAELSDQEVKAWDEALSKARESLAELYRQLQIELANGNSQRALQQSVRNESLATGARLDGMRRQLEAWLESAETDPRFVHAYHGDIERLVVGLMGLCWREMKSVTELVSIASLAAPNEERADAAFRSFERAVPSRFLLRSIGGQGPLKISGHPSEPDPRLADVLAWLEVLVPEGSLQLGPIPGDHVGAALEVELGTTIRHWTIFAETEPDERAAFAHLEATLRERVPW